MSKIVKTLFLQSNSYILFRFDRNWQYYFVSYVLL